MDTPNPQEEQKPKEEPQTELELTEQPPPAPAGAEATGVTLTPEVAKPITEGPVVVLPDTQEVREAVAAIAEAPSQPIQVMNQEIPATADDIKDMLGDVGMKGITEPAKRDFTLTTKKPTKKKKPAKKRYHKLEKPRRPVEHGLFAIKAKAGKTLGVKCLFCHDKLKYKSGRPPVICKKIRCFRDLRNAYRRDYAA